MISVTVTPGKQFADGEALSYVGLNLLGTPSFTIAGTVAGSDLAAGAVTPPKVVPGAYGYGAGLLTLNTYALSLTPALPALADGAEVWFKADATYLDAAATGIALLNVNGLGAAAIKKGRNLDLMPYDIVSGQIVGLRYESGVGVWQMLTPTSNTPLDYVDADTGSVNAFAIAPLPAFTTYAQLRGRLITFRAANANTGPATLAVNAISGAPTILKKGSEALVAGDIATGQLVTVVFDGTSFQLVSSSSAPVDPVVAVVSSTRNLIVTNNTIAPASKVDITAEEVVLKSALGRSLLVRSVVVTADMTLAGAGGLDAGIELASNWYYVWLVSDGTALHGMFSLSSTSPTLPANYIYSALIGAVRNDGSSNFAFFWQQDRKIALRPTIVFTAKVGVGASYLGYSAGAGGTDVDLRTLVPPVAKWLSGSMGGVAGQEAAMAIAGDSNGLGEQITLFFPTSVFALWGAAGAYRIPMVTPQTFYWKTLLTSAIYRLSVSGYEF